MLCFILGGIYSANMRKKSNDFWNQWKCQMDSYSFANAMRPFQWKHCECMDVSTKTLKKNSECIWTNANTEIPSRFCVTLKCVTFEKLLFITQFTFQIIFVRKTQFYYVYFSLCMMIMTGKNVEKNITQCYRFIAFLVCEPYNRKITIRG